ncbi:hypothetical protein GBA63_14435 [Rubrobacter tropicus]|uniref:Uncharacterized protein n=1 Tax=Rubrobacter tropicus TaxID=2653851 RepID=A0A6G8QB21_9ACTN|nr:hypothetical protein [Rubrobacter tropicus]QIN83694.1 hypothetical protein GBA63_14435 [Rubrobacter tropicus]
MGEIDKRKRTEEERLELANQVLALKEAGWTRREITKELKISSKSIQPLYDLAIANIPIPDKETVQRENIVQIRAKMDEVNRRLADPDLPITATNVPNLIHQWTKLRTELNKVLEVGVKTKVDIGIDGTLFDIIKNNPAYYEGVTDEIHAENDQRKRTAQELDVEEDVLEFDESDGVYKLPSEIEDDAKGES